MLLEGNVYVKSFYQSHFPKTFKEINDILEQTKDFDFSTEIKKTRIAFIDKLIDQCFKNKTTENKQPLQYLKSNKVKQHKFDSFILFQSIILTYVGGLPVGFGGFSPNNRQSGGTSGTLSSTTPLMGTILLMPSVFKTSHSVSFTF